MNEAPGTSQTPLAADDAASVYALLADGTTVEIRSAGPDDFDAIKAMHEAMSPTNTYMRFFSMSRTAAQTEARRLTRQPGPDHCALLALAGGEVVGAASYEVTKNPEDGTLGDTAEIAFAVADLMHHRGIATLLLEHLVSVARGQQLRGFVAETLLENTPMIGVFSDAGLPVTTRRADGVVTVTIPLPPDDAGTELDAYLDRVARRELSANVASLRPVFAPESVVVIGAGRRHGNVGHSVVDNILKGGFTGRVYAVNPYAQQISGVPSFPDVAHLPEPPDLAVIAVPPPGVVDVAEACGVQGVRGLVVLTAGLDTAQSTDLLAACRRHGMRLIGPNCFGIAVPATGLDATFSATAPLAGVAGLVTQSGGLGFAMVDQLSRLGIGISSFASVGNKLDVSSNDMLMWWERDGVTKLAVLYIESFGNPRKFARTARRVGAKMPVLTVHAGRSETGQQAAASHTRAIATPQVTRDALFEQAGIIATAGYGELIEATALLATQPIPEGRTVAIVSNVGGAGVLTADACHDLGLAVHHPRGQRRRTLHSLMPEGSSANGPVDTTATISGDEFRLVLEHLAADEDVDAVIVLVLPTAPAPDIVAAIHEATVRKPIAAVVLNQPEAVRLLGDGRDEKGAVADGLSGATEERGSAAREAGRAQAPVSGGSGGSLPRANRVPSYGYPEAAVRALARAARYGEWRSSPHHEVPRFPDIEGHDGAATPGIAPVDEARAVVRAFLARTPGGGWLAHVDRHALLRAYGIPVAPIMTVHSEDDAAFAFAAPTGSPGPVVLKADVPGLVHKSDAGGVLLDLRTEADVRDGYRKLASRFGPKLHGVGVQPMITGGTEVMIGVADDLMFGPLVIFGLGGVATEVLADHSARLAPLTAHDADMLIDSIRSAPLLRGHYGAPAADLAALRDVLMRVSRLADDIPEISELDLNPVVARPDGAVAVDARIRVVPQAPLDPFLRRLRLSAGPARRSWTATVTRAPSPVPITPALSPSCSQVAARPGLKGGQRGRVVIDIPVVHRVLVVVEVDQPEQSGRILGALKYAGNAARPAGGRVSAGLHDDHRSLGDRVDLVDR
ncbi:MAG TPA: GNAT family N-acetyltransferase [Trebonia sp.]|jgi:acyl-CoA synthetase (NDP forming)/GNAT superfamily N-acetyltransferase|nr:GNAT family N-acetyltransferase [Trebonia sp.]